MPPFEFLGPYRIGKPLGKGGMGTVFAAIHEKTGEKVAVKLIASHVADEARFRRRFDDEVKTLQQLRHPNIVRLIGFGEEDGQLFYSMELVEGETLQARIRREKKISWLPALNISIDICAALKHAHDFGVIHRDLKPANLLLGSDDGVKLVDFGIAKIFGEGEQTLAGSVLGTADYMAPEQATGSGVTVRTDLYALGSVMYAMLTGRPPFRGKSVTQVIESLKRDRPVPLELVDPNLPEEVVELVHQLLEKEPDSRPPTALSVTNRLKAMRAGLQREETVVAEGSATKVGGQKKREPDSGGSSGPIDPDSATDDSDAKSSHRKGTVVTKGGVNRAGKVDPDGATVVSGEDSSQTDDPAQPVAVAPESQSEMRTHFQTVSESERRPGRFDIDASDGESVWASRLAIVGMLAALVLTAGLFGFALLGPSADQLYASVIDDQDSGAMKSFLKRFPDDPRFDEVLNLHMNHRLEGQIRRLSTQRRLGVTPLDAHEESFLTALDGRLQQPTEAIKRLDQWLVVYDSPESELDDTMTTLIELARHERDQLRGRAPAVIIDPRAEEMIAEIRSLANQSDTDSARNKLNAIIESFQSIDWAQPAVEEAKRQIQVFAEFSDEP